MTYGKIVFSLTFQPMFRTFHFSLECMLVLKSIASLFPFFFGEIDCHQMDQIISRERDFESDLESGGNTSEEDESRDLDPSERHPKNLFGWAWNTLLDFDRFRKHETGVETCSSSSKSADVMDDDVQVHVDACLEDLQMKLPQVKNNNSKEKNKKPNSKPPKPPRPPKGPLLDAADQKLVQEIAELALRKRERMKKLKAVRKMKARKGSSSSSYAGLSAMVITIFFFAIIIIQGINAGRSTAVGVMASPEPSIAADEGLISVRFSKNFTHEVLQGK
ncbi:uncharacterized protein LOC129320083 isoform X3 [Prosopis cineraria]|uniref:uncharacterized protein LOC129320083 isoform X3 n=1 Tax=Prosopis cineraria TaxID=364024 RepID=UPI00240F3CF6|nr:uncharacterized protein LOC129320083 isoform X3 [Prosopis cineraria]